MSYDHLGTAFTATFEHKRITVNNTQIHYVTGGSGAPLVLLHGYPQTWYAFRRIMPELSKHFTVIVPDLRGLGDSDKPGSGYDTATVAEDIYQLVSALGYERISLLGHDFGVNVAYAYAACHRNAVSKLVLLDAGMLDNNIANSPLLPKEGKSLWWFPFQMMSVLPEELVAGKEAIYLNWFYQNLTFNKEAIADADLQEYVRCYAATGGIKAGFDYYRALFTDIEFNARQVEVKLKIPVLVLGGKYSFGLKPFESWKAAAENINGGIIKNSGHYIPEEQPQLLLEQVVPFLKDS
ncbi:alpha/beta fold hydrolase [Mucilaginibacter terrae]|uniref:alpha/beta fold hydrolase n=1 Tax=Mucilaginibacter terrae TaxID=1955052 RepID=UPI00362B7E3C